MTYVETSAKLWQAYTTKFEGEALDAHERRALLLTAVVLGGAVLFLHAVSDILLPFIVGLLLAYLLNPAVGFLERRGVPRALASVVPVGAAVALITAVLVLGMPLLMDQLSSFAQRLPVYLMTLQHFVIPDKLSRALHWDMDFVALLKPLGTIGAQGAEWTVQALQKTLSGVAWLVNVALLVLMTPVVAFYLLLDWPKLMEKIVKLFPKRWRRNLLEINREIDVKLAAYLRGTVAVCLSMALYYSLALSSIGIVSTWMRGTPVSSLELGWAIGIATGVMAFLPVIGATIGVTMMFAVALMQYQLLVWEPYALIGGYFIVGQFLEGYVMQPLLVGQRVGLHPLWVIFALLAGGTLAGITGMLLAVPVAVVFSVLLPRLLRQWRAAID
ncbi:MAG: AI-2E family transporter [Proteobacteria bacterium]|nr:AI-2E family transporter [Pseudomonadota bacterium]